MLRLQKHLVNSGFSTFEMLEGVVARLLNQLLGKYVADLDSENFNVGIFSGQVQLTDLKLKTEALVSGGYFVY